MTNKAILIGTTSDDAALYATVFRQIWYYTRKRCSLALSSPLDRWRPTRNAVFDREEPSCVPRRRDPQGSPAVSYRAGALGVSGATASAASLIRRAVGATSVGGREAAWTVRGSSMGPL